MTTVAFKISSREGTSADALADRTSDWKAAGGVGRPFVRRKPEFPERSLNRMGSWAYGVATAAGPVEWFPT